MKKQKNRLLWSVMSLVFVLANTSPMASHAQILRNLGKRVEQKVEEQANRRIERRIDRAIDKGMDKVEQGVEDAVTSDGNKTGTSGTPTQTDTPSNAAISMQSIFGGSNIVVKDEYKFAVGVSYDMTSTENNKEEPLPGTTLWLSSENYMGVGTAMQQGMFMVVDEGGMITFMENDKRYLAMSADMMGKMAESVAEHADVEISEADYTFARVGSAEILGQPCEIYEVKSADAHTRVWITQALGVDVRGFASAFSSFMKNSPAKVPNLSEQPAGVLLKMESTILESGQQVTMEATEIHRDGKTFSTAGYQRFGM